jgi:UDP-glucuronate decarboxylase
MNGPDEFTGPVNLGNPVEFSMLDLAKLIISLADSKSGIVFKSLPVDDALQRQPDITLAIQRLGWHPYTDLESGLKKTIEYFRNIILD